MHLLKTKYFHHINITFTLPFILMGLLLSNNLHAAEYTIAVRAHNGIDTAIKKWTATVDYLSTTIPRHNFKLLPFVSLDELTIAGGKKKYDFVLTNPSSYIELNKSYNAKALATLNNKRANTTQDKFGSVIFVHASNDNIFNLDDLKNKTLMAVSPSAFGGWRVAWLELQKQGINPYEDFKAVIYSKNSLQKQVVYAVRDRKADAGVVRTDQLERMESSGKIDMRNFRILNNKDVKGFPFFLSTDLYPEWAFAAMGNIPNETAMLVQKKLLLLSSNSKAAVTGKYIGWVQAKDYRTVEELMKKLNVGPYSKTK